MIINAGQKKHSQIKILSMKVDGEISKKNLPEKISTYVHTTILSLPYPVNVDVVFEVEQLL